MWCESFAKPARIRASSSRIPAGRFLSLACPRERNQREGHPQRPGRRAPARRLRDRVTGFVDGPFMDRNERARIVRAPLRARPPPARRAARGPRLRSARILRAQSRSIAASAAPTEEPRPAFVGAAEVAMLLLPGPLRRRWTADDQARRGARWIARVRRDAGMHRRRPPAGVHEPSAQRKAAPSGCPFFWFLFFGQAKKRNRPAGMRDENARMRVGHREKSRLSCWKRKQRPHGDSALTLPSPASRRGEIKSHGCGTNMQDASRSSQ